MKHNKKKAEIILGIDPGYDRLGFGLVDFSGVPVMIGCGIIKTKASDRFEIRLLQIKKDIDFLIKRHKPNLIVTEQLFFSKSTTTALKVAEVRGVILLAAAEAGISIIEIHPRSVKLAITGYGGAEKASMQKMVARLLNLPRAPKPDDAADALALALCGALGSWREIC